MKVIGKDRTSCDVCNPIDEILARLDALERRASAIVAKVQGIAPDGEGNVTLPTSSSDTDPLHGRVDAFAMSSEVKEAADDAHAYAASIADDVIVINSEIVALNQAVEALQPAEIEAIKLAVQTLQTTVATLESTVATLNNSVAGKVSKSGDTMTGSLSINNSNSIIRKTTLESNNSANAVTEVGRLQFRSASNETANLISVSSPANNSAYLRATRNVEGKGVDADIIAIVGANGNRYGIAPSWSPGTNDNSDKILTIKMANSLPSLVHSTGNEAIAGQKIFTSNPTIRADNLEAGLGLMCNKAVGDIDGWTRNALIGFFWKDYVYNGFITTTRDPTNSAMEMTASNGNGANASILIIQPNDGSAGWANAPTTPSNARGTEIATADWVLARINELATKNGLNGL